MIIAQKNEISIKNETVRVTVPNNSLARLMYYLTCINTVLDLTELDINIDYEFISVLKDYQNYHLVNYLQKQKIISYAKLLKPGLFENKVFFKYNNLENFSNEFYALNSTEINVAATSEVLIGGVRKKVLKVMLYKSGWIQTFYFDALRDIEREMTPGKTFNSIIFILLIKII